MLLKPSTMPLKLKLPLLMVLLTVAFVVTVSFLIYTLAERGIRENVETAQASKAQAGAQALTFRIDAALNDVANLGAQPTVFRAMGNFERVISMIEDPDPIGYMKRHYIDQNPNEEALRANLVDPGDGSYYTQSHVTYHPTFVQTMEVSGYSDMYLVTMAGLVVYSVKKSTAFAEDIKGTALAGTPFAKVVEAAMTAEPGKVVVQDFAPYAGGNYAFVASPVLSKTGEPVGILVVRLGTDMVETALTANLSDLGHENIYIVSPDGLARSPSVIPGGFEMMDELPNTPQIAAARAGETAQFREVMTANGHSATAVVVPLAVDGFNWAVVMETDSATAFAMVDQIRWMVLGLIGAAVVVSIGVSWAAANRVTRPIHQLRDVTNALLARTDTLPPPPENPMSADRVRWEHIQRVYELCDHNVSETARRLGMHRRTLQRILAKRAPR